MEFSQPATDRYLTLSLGRAVFAVSIHSVREILDDLDITAIPHAAAAMRGIVDVRGEAVTVWDLGAVLGLDAVAHTRNTRIVIVELRQGDGLVLAGLLADAVREVLEIEGHDVQPPPQACGGMLRGVARDGARFVFLLDMDVIVRSNDFYALADAAGDAPEAGEMRS